MITIPLADIKTKIKEQSSLSEEDINVKIKKKLDELSGLISEEGAAHIIANELNVKLVQVTEPGEKIQVKNILAGMKNIEVIGKITRKFELREFQTEKRSGKLASFMIADETGFIRIVLWNNQTDNFTNLKEGDVVKLENGYVKDNNGRKEIHLGDNGKITINPEGVQVKAVERQVAKRKQLSDIQEGDDNIEVLGTIVQVFDLRFFEIDPQTGKRAQPKEGKYYVGDKEISNIGYGYVMNIFLDDGTENVRTVLWKKQIQNLLGKSEEEIIKYKDSPADFEPIKTELLGTIIKIIGRVNKNQSFDRLELVANVVFKDVDPEKEIKKLETEKNNDSTTKDEEDNNNNDNNNDSESIVETTTKENITDKEPLLEEETLGTDTEEVSEEKKEESLSIDDLENI